MSTPVRGAEGPLGYAPRWARGSESGRADTAFDGRARNSTLVQELPQDLRPPRVAASHREAVSGRDSGSARDLFSTREAAPLADAAFEADTELPNEPAPHWEGALPRASAAVPPPASDSLWKRKKRSEVFEGDAALKELRSRLASAPDQAPEPPLYQAKTPIFAAVVRLMGVMVLAAAGALGFLWITAPRGAPPQVTGKPGSGDVALVSYPTRGLEASQKPASAVENVVTQRTPDTPPSGSPWAVANLNVTNATDGVGALPSAVAPRVPATPRAPASRVTPPPAAPAPAVTAPTPPPAAVAPAAVVPPPVAPVPASRVPAIAAPVSATPPPTPAVALPDRDEVAALLARARTYLAAGDVAAARLVLRRAAERDDAQAALALGGTFDPIVLKRLGIVNFHADPAQAREWYHKAAELGSPDASLRLEQLVQTDR